MDGIYTYKSSKSEFTVTQRELGEFSNRFPETAALRNRIAEFFWFNLYALEKDQGVNPNDVLREIIALESSTNTFRKPTPFERKPLKGLMHTHWFSARFIPHYIKYGLGPDGIKNAVEAFFPNGVIEADLVPICSKLVRVPICSKLVRRRSFVVKHGSCPNPYCLQLANRRVCKVSR